MNAKLPEDPTSRYIELRKIELERYKANLDFRKFVLGSVFVALAVAAIPPLFQLATAVLEYVKSEAARATKQQQSRDEYIKDFLANALSQDIELRIRFADYFAHVADERYRAGWIRYRETLVNNRKDSRALINQMEAEWQRKAHILPVDQVELEKIARMLSWAYREVGYFEGNRSVALDPRAPTAQSPVASLDPTPNDQVAQPARYLFGPNRANFYSKLESTAIGNITPSQKEGLEVILDYWVAKYSSFDARMLAYILATAYHESDRTLQPMEEFGKGKGRPWGDPEGNGNVYYGRGYIQLTWAVNYKRAGQFLGLNLYDNPDLALVPGNSAAILVEGMMRGIFSGRKLADYFMGERADWINARRIINGLDRAVLIAGYAASFFDAIKTT